MVLDDDTIVDVIEVSTQDIFNLSAITVFTLHVANPAACHCLAWENKNILNYILIQLAREMNDGCLPFSRRGSEDSHRNSTCSLPPNPPPNNGGKQNNTSSCPGRQNTKAVQNGYLVLVHEKRMYKSRKSCVTGCLVTPWNSSNSFSWEKSTG